MSTKFCDYNNKHGFACGAPATFRVWWQATGDDESVSCALHIAKAIRLFQSRHPGDTIKTRAI